jgi:hypothetical protein
MEDYIYILIGIVWVAYSLYSARQKAIKKQQSAGLPQRGPSQSSPLPIPGGGGKSLLEDIFRELSGEQPVPVPQAGQPERQPFYRPEAETLKTIEVPASSKVSPNIPVPSANSFKKEYGNESKNHPIYDQLTKNERIVKNFNLREAVIFSELLNRKYF